MTKRGRKKGEAITKLLLELDQNWHIKCDSNCYILCRKRFDSSGNRTVDENVGYYGDLAGLIGSYPDHRLRRSKASGLTQVVEELKEIKSEVKKISDALQDVKLKKDIRRKE
jgi:hypothetical protein